MANIGELRYLLSLDPSRFVATLKKAVGDSDQAREKVEKPFNLKANVDTLLTRFAKLGLALDGIRQTYQVISGPIQAANREYLEQEKSIRKIEAAAKLTGVGLSDLQGVADTIKTEFRLTTTQANEFVVAANKLAVAAGDTSQTGEVLKRLFDLAAGQGLNASEALLRFEQAIKGVDEGTEALFSGKNPIDLYKEYAESIGVSVTKMDDQQKKQAILNAIMRDGTTLQGEYNKFLNDAAGQQSQAANATAELRAQLGQIFNEAYVPLLRIITPLIEGFAGLDAGMRNSGIATAGFLAIAIKAPAVIGAIRTAILALSSTLGPAGVLLVAIGAAATALGVYQASAEEATEANKSLETSNKNVAESFKEIKNAANIEFAGLSLEKLENIRGRLANLVTQTEAQFKRLSEAAKQSGSVDDQAAAAAAGQALSRQKARLAAVEDLIVKQSGAAEQLTQKELEELDKRREYEFETNRISLADYIAYLRSRLEAQRQALGAESAEYLRFVDRIANLEQQLRDQRAQDQAAGILPDQIQVRETKDSLLTEVTDLYTQLREIQLTFQAQNFEDLQAEYNARLQASELNLQIIKETAGEGSEIYRKELKTREQLQKSYTAAKIELEYKGFEQTVALGEQLVTAFQGQSRTLFDIGKGLAIAETTINTIQAVNRALKDYPFPFSAAIAAIVGAIGAAQVAQISSTKFEPKGKAEGGIIRRGDVADSPATPAGEDGIVGIQVGEYVVNRAATKRFFPLLQAINNETIEYRRVAAGRIPGYATGGLVSNVGGVPAGAVDSGIRTAADIEDAVEAGIRRGLQDSKILIDGRLVGRGKDLQAILDKYAELKSSI